MNGESKVSSRHLQRLAVIYVRQSTLAQVRDHGESTARQYGLQDTAIGLGWDSSQILVLDGDLGLSGRSGSNRADFKELVSRVCVGEVGSIFGLEVSRLARNSADLQRLLEFCNLTDTLIVDADGIYDLRNFNDRLLLGLKGTMSEAELHILAGRLQESKRAAARRGELRLPIPVGYVYDEEQVVMDLDEEVHSAIADVFLSFAAAGSAYGVVGAFRERKFPCRGFSWTGEIRWGHLTHSRAMEILNNPTYAGAYVSGRHRSERRVDPEGVIRTRTVELPREEWSVVIQNHHAGYISWDAFLANQVRLTGNRTQQGARPPREGSALLQGLVQCGRCGRPMGTEYHSGRPHYCCSHSRADQTNRPGCRSVAAVLVDPAVTRRLLEAVAPHQIELALAAADEVTDRRARATRAVELRVERARYEADRAERAFHLCEPENRLVARHLERRWEAKLGAVADAEAAAAAAQTVSPTPTTDELQALAQDLPRLWSASTTSARDRKRLLRTLIADVTVESETVGDQVKVGIHWQSGACEQLQVTRSGRRTPAAVLELVRRLALAGHRNESIAAELRGANLLTGRYRPFDAEAVRRVRSAYHIEPAPLIGPTELSPGEVAARLGISVAVVYYWAGHGHLTARHTEHGRVGIPFPQEVEKACRRRIAASSHIRIRTEEVAVGGAV